MPNLQVNRVAVLGGSHKLPLISYWNMDEISNGSASVTRKDSISGNNLTDNNHCASAAGLYGNAVQFTAASSQSLSIASNPSLVVTGRSFAWDFAVNFNSLGDGTHPNILIDKGGAIGSPAGFDYAIYLNAPTPRLIFSVSNGSAVTNVSDSTPIVTGVWYTIHVFYDAVAKSISIQVNSKPPAVAAFAGTINNSGNGLQFGSEGIAGFFLDGLMDEVRFSKAP